jgi:propionyl-CoA synthetase
VDYDAVIYGSEETLAYLLTLHPLYILYTSGTTGKPKFVTRWLRCCIKIFDAKIYNIKEDDVWAASDVGWVVGHSFIVYGPLINRNSSIIF